jgi:hypothetical protein
LIDLGLDLLGALALARFADSARTADAVRTGITDAILIGITLGHLTASLKVCALR